MLVESCEKGESSLVKCKIKMKQLSTIEKELTNSSYQAYCTLTPLGAAYYIDSTETAAYDFLSQLLIGRKPATRVVPPHEKYYRPFLGQATFDVNGELVVDVTEASDYQASVIIKKHLGVDLLEIYRACEIVDMVVSLSPLGLDLAALFTGPVGTFASVLLSAAVVVTDKFTDEWTWFKRATGISDQDMINFFKDDRQILELGPPWTTFSSDDTDGFAELYEKPTLYLVPYAISK